MFQARSPLFCHSQHCTYLALVPCPPNTLPKYQPALNLSHTFSTTYSQPKTSRLPHTTSLTLSSSSTIRSHKQSPIYSAPRHVRFDCLRPPLQCPPKVLVFGRPTVSARHCRPLASSSHPHPPATRHHIMSLRFPTPSTTTTTFTTASPNSQPWTLLAGRTTAP